MNGREALMNCIERFKNTKLNALHTEKTSSHVLCVNGLPYLTFIQRTDGVVSDDSSLFKQFKDFIKDPTLVNKIRIKIDSNDKSYVTFSNIYNTSNLPGYGFICNIDPSYCIVKKKPVSGDTHKFLPRNKVPDSTMYKFVRNPNYRNLIHCIEECYNNSFMSLIESFDETDGWEFSEIPEVRGFNFTTQAYRSLCEQHSSMDYDTLFDGMDNTPSNSNNQTVVFAKHLLHINVELGHFYVMFKNRLKYNKPNQSDINCCVEYVPMMIRFNGIPCIPLKDDDLRDDFLKMFPKLKDDDILHNLKIEPFLIESPLLFSINNSNLSERKLNNEMFFFTRGDAKILLQSNNPENSNNTSPYYVRDGVFTSDDIKANSILKSEILECDVYDYRQLNSKIISYFLAKKGWSVIDFTKSIKYTLKSRKMISVLSAEPTEVSNFVAFKALFNNSNTENVTMYKYTHEYSCITVRDVEKSKNNKFISRKFVEQYLVDNDGTPYYSDYLISELPPTNSAVDTTMEYIFESNGKKYMNITPYEVNNPALTSLVNCEYVHGRDVSSLYVLKDLHEELTPDELQNSTVKCSTVINVHSDNDEESTSFTNSAQFTIPDINKNRILLEVNNLHYLNFAGYTKYLRVTASPNDFILFNYMTKSSDSDAELKLTDAQFEELNTNWNSWLAQFI